MFSTQVLEHPTVDSRFKTSFKWLGYYLELKKSGILWLDEEEVDTKLNSQEFFARKIFQYSDSLAFRWKIWKTYFSPFVELFLPAVFQKSFASRTRVHVFQHKLMCWALNLNTCASSKRLLEATGEPSVEFKAQRAASRLLNATNNRYGFTIKRSTGRHKSTPQKHLPQGVMPYISPTDRKDLVFRMNLFVQEDWVEHNHLKFNTDRVKKFVSKENKRIRYRALNNWDPLED